MNISASNNPQALHLSFGEHRFEVELKDGRILSIPYTWFPRLIVVQDELLKHPEHLPFNATESAAQTGQDAIVSNIFSMYAMLEKA